MALNAAKAGQGITAASWNELMAMQDFQLIYEGSLIDSVTGAGVVENSLADYSYLAMFTLTGVTTLGRVELELDKDGTGADVTVQIMDSTLETIKTVVIPKEFIPSPKAYVSVPIGLTGLTSGGTYYIYAAEAGDSTNKVDWVGEASTSAGHTCYKNDGGGAVEMNALHFKVYSGNTGDLIHGVYGTNLVETYIYAGEDLTTIWRYCPPSDGATGGIRDIIDITFDGDYLTDGAVT